MKIIIINILVLFLFPLGLRGQDWMEDFNSAKSKINQGQFAESAPILKKIIDNHGNNIDDINKLWEMKALLAACFTNFKL